MSFWNCPYFYSGRIMKNFGFIKVASAIPFGKVAGVEYNKNQIISMIHEAGKKNASIVVFPELAVTGYTCGDLFHTETLIKESLKALTDIAESTRDISVLSIVGCPLINNNKLYNTAVVINKGRFLGVVPKTYLPNYREFYEGRWFDRGVSEYAETIRIGSEEVRFGNDLLFKDRLNAGLIIGIEICEDVWVPVQPSSLMAQSGAVIICNLSASNVLAAKNEYRLDLVKNQSARTIAGYVYTSAGTSESTADVVFDADGIIAENGIVLAQSKRFIRKSQIIYSEIDVEKLVYERIRRNTFENASGDFEYVDFESTDQGIELTRKVDAHPFIPEKKENLGIRCEEIFNIQSAGLAKRIESIPGSKMVIGISGGLDSTLALLVAIKTCKILGRNLTDIIGITMPGFGTTENTYNNSKNLCKSLGISFKDIGIKDISNDMFEAIGQNSQEHDVTYENVQARARTFILMSIANKEKGIVVGTGDLSEIALGWSTYNGDHMSMYNVNSSIPKTLVKFLVRWVAENEFDGHLRKILIDITDQPISPELKPSDGKKITQKTEDEIGPYELHDFFLHNFVRFGFTAEKILFLAQIAFKGKYEEKTVRKWLRVFFTRFFANQWKRECVPNGPKVGSIDLSPRGSWRMPPEADVEIFLENI
jgi:NAD+ synthase (glutamine-hydrolysing)